MKTKKQKQTRDSVKGLKQKIKNLQEAFDFLVNERIRLETINEFLLQKLEHARGGTHCEDCDDV